MLEVKMLKKLLWISSLTSYFIFSAAAQDITLYRFFGSCDDEFGAAVDLDKAVGECGIIQVLTNNFNEVNKDGIHVKTQTVDWYNYYTQLNATMASGDVPEIAVMHRSQIPNFISRDLIEPLDDLFAEAGIDVDDFADSAIHAISFDDKIYALPFDLHTLLWHMNMDLLAKAGLIDAQGEPILPTSFEEFEKQAQMVKEKTGKNYLSLAGSVDAMPPRLLYSLLYQQNSSPVNSEGTAATLTTSEGQKAASFIKNIYDKNIATASHDYPGSEQAFLNGEAAILINGTWVIDSYDHQAKSGSSALKNYNVRTFPQLLEQKAVWADSHMWVIPKGAINNENERKAAGMFLKHLYDHNGLWAKTGHFPVRKSVLESAQYNELPFRSNIIDTVDQAKGLPLYVLKQTSIQDIIREELEATYTTDKDITQALSDAEARIKRILRKRR